MTATEKKPDMQTIATFNQEQFQEYFQTLNTPPQPKNGKWTIRQLVYLTFPEFWALWKTLPAPDFYELNGEYSGYCPDGKNLEIRKRTVNQMFTESLNLGYWLGKAMKPVAAGKGEGYNVYRQPGEWINRFLRFGTAMGNSLIDGKPAYMLYYGHFKTGAGKNELTDEVRKLEDGIYLGVGTVKAPDGGRSIPGPFVLAGPVRPWQGVEDDDDER